jgi:hypothetical protein
MLPTRQTCSWCHTLHGPGSRGWPSCPECGHRADIPRMACDCRRCRPSGAVLTPRALALMGSLFDLHAACLAAEPLLARISAGHLAGCECPPCGVLRTVRAALAKARGD